MYNRDEAQVVAAYLHKSSLGKYKNDLVVIV